MNITYVLVVGARNCRRYDFFFFFVEFFYKQLVPENII